MAELGRTSSNLSPSPLLFTPLPPSLSSAQHTCMASRLHVEAPPIPSSNSYSVVPLRPQVIRSGEVALGVDKGSYEAF